MWIVYAIQRVLVWVDHFGLAQWSQGCLACSGRSHLLVKIATKHIDMMITVGVNIFYIYYLVTKCYLLTLNVSVKRQ